MVSFIIAPSYSYSNEDPITIPPGKIWNFESILPSTSPQFIWNPTGSFSQDPLTTSILFFRHMNLGSITIDGYHATDVFFIAENCFINGLNITNGSSITIALQGNTNVVYDHLTTNLVASVVLNPIDCDQATILTQNTQFNDTINCGKLFAKSCSFNNNIIVNNHVTEIMESIFKSAVIFDFVTNGYLDQSTYGNYLLNNCQTNNGILSSDGVLISLLNDKFWDTDIDGYNISLSILPANHPMGLYEFKMTVTITKNIAGFITPTQIWSDPHVGPQSSDGSNISTNNMGAVNVVFGTSIIQSNGTIPLSLNLFYMGNPGVMRCWIAASAIRVG